MAKNKTLFWVDIALFVLLAITLLAVPTEVFTHSFIHVFSGMALSAVALFHIILHWSWVKNAVQHFNRLPDKVRSNALLNLGLSGAYILCAGMGSFARAMLVIFPFHFFLGVIHVLLAVAVIALQLTHIIRHWKWVTTTARRMIPQIHLPIYHPSHLMTGYIKLDNRLCQACWKCVEACPNHVLGKAIVFNHRHAHVDQAAACKGCKKCIRVCPNQAILSRNNPPRSNGFPVPNRMA